MPKEPDYEVGDHIHLGLAGRGGTGFEGEIIKADKDNYHIKGKYDPKRTFKGPKRYASLIKKRTAITQHTEQPANYLEHLKQGGLPHEYKEPVSDQ